MIMLGNVLNRVLQIIYPALVFGFVLLVWSSSNLAEVVSLTPPPVNDGFNFFWNPSLLSRYSCEQRQDSKFPFNQLCSTNPSGNLVEQFTNSSAKKVNQTN